MRTYTPACGDDIANTCNTLVDLAATHCETVTAEFNGVIITAEPGMAADVIQAAWGEETDRRRSAYEASSEGQAAKKRQEEAQRRAAESAKEGIVAFDVSDDAEWQKWRGSNEDGGYSEACLRYAARWAAMMDQQIAGGAALKDIADPTSHEADTEGITVFMFGAAVSMLLTCWRHGDELRRWHNLKSQIGDEGTAANEGGGVLNPAMLRIG